MTTLAQISETQAQKATTANENFATVSPAGIYGRKASTTSGLTWGYYGGIFPGNYSAIADGTLSLTGNATNYIEADTATGALSVNTSGWTASGKKRVYSVTTNASAVTAYTDYRTVLDIAAAALAGANTWTGVNTFDEDVIIGSGSPSATLTCNGPVTINSSLTINGWIAGPVSFTGQVTFDEDVVIGSGSPTATLTCNGPVTVNGTLAVEGTVDLTPTGTVTINPATAGAMNNVVIGALTPLAGTFTTGAFSSTITTTTTAVNAVNVTPGADQQSYYRVNTTVGVAEFGVLSGGVGYVGSTSTDDFRIYGQNAIAITCGSGGSVSLASTLQVVGNTVTGSAAGTLHFQDGLRVGADSTNTLLDDASNGAGTATLYIGNASINVTSDRRLKAHIKAVVETYSDAAIWGMVDRSRVVTHTWNDPSDKAVNNRNTRGPFVGLIAQEQREVTPWAVNKPLNERDPWFIEHVHLVPLLMRDAQITHGHIKDHETRLKALEARSH